MYQYGICNVPDEEVFYKQCSAIEKAVPGLQKEKILQDVDDSLIQIYYFNGKKIKVANSHYTGDVYVESEIDLLPFFNSKAQ